MRQRRDLRPQHRQVARPDRGERLLVPDVIRLLSGPLDDADEAVRLRVRQRAQQHGFDDTEDRRRRSDSQCQRDDDDAGKGRTAGQLSKRVAKILNRMLDPGDAVHLADVLAQEGGIAELPPRGDVRLVGRHPLPAIVLGQRVQVRVDLQPHVLVQAPARQHEDQAGDDGAKTRPHFSPSPRHLWPSHMNLA